MDWDKTLLSGFIGALLSGGVGVFINIVQIRSAKNELKKQVKHALDLEAHRERVAALEDYVRAVYHLMRPGGSGHADRGEVERTLLALRLVELRYDTPRIKELVAALQGEGGTMFVSNPHAAAELKTLVEAELEERRPKGHE